MKQRFLYSELRGFKSVNERLDHETANWTAEGMVMQGKQSRVASNLNGDSIGGSWEAMGFYKTRYLATFDWNISLQGHRRECTI